MAAKAPVGQVLKTLRKQRGWTLAEVSKRSGLAASTLSKVENGRMSLTFDKIVSLCRGLEIDISVLLSPGPAVRSGTVSTGRRSIDRGGGSVVETANYGHRYLNTEISNKRMVPVIVEHHARTIDEFGPLVRHEGEEFVYVLEGAIEVHTEFYAPTTLHQGDSIYIDSTMAHAYLAKAEGPCRTLSVITAPEARFRQAVDGQNSGETGDFIL